MLCRAIPYEGREPYIFFSYSHKDSARVYPLLEQMVRDGYRVWYDDGNHPGDDWLENIGQHLQNCNICLAMMSQNSEESHNCKQEVSFAVQCDKRVMAVKLEEFAMTVGMRLQLSTIHYLVRTDYPSDLVLLQKLYETDGMQDCRSAPGSLPMRSLPEEQQEKTATYQNHKAGEQKAGISSLETRYSEGSQKLPGMFRKMQAGVDAGEEHATHAVKHPAGGKILLLRRSDATCFVSDKNVVKVGRNENACDFVLKNNYISKHHMDIILENGACYLQDAGSANGTFLNGERLPANSRIQVGNAVNFQLHSEGFILIFGEAAAHCAARGEIAYLRNPATESVRILSAETFHLDRLHPWEDGTLDHEKISRHHAQICCDSEGYYLEDLGSSNGTCCNEQRLASKAKYRLRNGDKIRLVDTVLEMNIVTF